MLRGKEKSSDAPNPIILKLMLIIFSFLGGISSIMFLGFSRTPQLSRSLIFALIMLGPAIIATALFLPLLWWRRRQGRRQLRVWPSLAHFGGAALGGSLLVPGVLLIGLYFSFDTEYSVAYSEAAFRTIDLGIPAEEVFQRLGQPLEVRETAPYTVWVYSDQSDLDLEDHELPAQSYTAFYFDEAGRVKNIFGQLLQGNVITLGGQNNYLGLSSTEIEQLKGKTQIEIEQLYGTPTAAPTYETSQYLIYSRSPSSSNYWLRQIGLNRQGRVVEIRQEIYWD